MHKKYVRFKRDLNRRKRAAQNSAERRVDREGGASRDTERAFAFIKETFSRKTKRLLFCGGGKAIAGRLGAQRKAAKFRKREEQRTVRASLRTEKRRQRALNAALSLLDATKNFRPSAAEASAQLRCKSSKKAKGILLFLRLVFQHCRWLSMTLSKRGSAFPKDPSEQKSGN